MLCTNPATLQLQLSTPRQLRLCVAPILQRCIWAHARQCKRGACAPVEANSVLLLLLPDGDGRAHRDHHAAHGRRREGVR